MEKEKIRAQLQACKDDINMLIHLLEDERVYHMTDGDIGMFDPTETLNEAIKGIKEHFE